MECLVGEGESSIDVRKIQMLKTAESLVYLTIEEFTPAEKLSFVCRLNVSLNNFTLFTQECEHMFSYLNGSSICNRIEMMREQKINSNFTNIRREVPRDKLMQVWEKRNKKIALREVWDWPSKLSI